MALSADPELTRAYRAAKASWDAQRMTERLWAKDPSVWTSSGEEKWLGWLDAATPHRAALDDIARRANAAAPSDISEILLIGMGGSSLAPEVIARTIPAAHARTLRILDSTHPAAVAAALERTSWPHAAIVVASKSGSTLEPDILLAAAVEAARQALGDVAPKRVIAITDPGSRLAAQAREQGFADVFLGDPSIGGRFSALSPFGLVNAALRHIDLHAFTQSAVDMAAQCRAPAAENPGVQLGVYLATAAAAGRDKCTLILPRSLMALGAWIEQLIAESTGKNGLAILPIDGERVGAPAVYGADRAFVRVRDVSATDADIGHAAALIAAGHPVFEIEVPSVDALAGEFFRWEFATAVAGALLGINPFDQPDVEAAKIATRALTDAYERGERPETDPPDDDAALRAHLSSIVPGDYVALLAFLPMFSSVERALHRTRRRIRDAKRVATSLGFGPRFLHSTGQAFKGGPNTGVFVQLTWDGDTDLPVLGRKNLTFGTVVASQAAGDRAVLRERGRRIVHLDLRGDLATALDQFDAAVEAALTQNASHKPQ
jgi:transaldolase/glucose-6-phosphate isomerase